MYVVPKTAACWDKVADQLDFDVYAKKNYPEKMQ